MNGSTRQIIEHIIANPQGGTAHRSGKLATPEDGYWVGGRVSPLMLDQDEQCTAEGRANLVTFIDYATESVGAAYVGWWTDADTDVLYVDATDWFASYAMAAAVARKRRELAFYDIAGKGDVRLAYVDGE